MISVKSIKEANFDGQKLEDYWVNNIAISNFDEFKSHKHLRNFSDKYAKGLMVFNVPGKSLKDKKVFLYDVYAAGSNRAYFSEIAFFLALARQFQDGKEITLWYLTTYDRAVAQIVADFIKWASEKLEPVKL